MSAIDQINSDEQMLWSSFLEGDNSGLEKLYRKYFDELHGFGMKWLNDSHLTEDAIQDLFIKLMNNRRTLSLPANVKYYLFRAFRTNVLDKMRVAKKRPVQSVDGREDYFFIELNTEQHLIHSEEEALQVMQLQKAIDGLTPRQREAIYLRYMKGFSYQEISQMMELTDKGAYKLMARAIQSLKENIPGLLAANIPLILRTFIE